MVCGLAEYSDGDVIARRSGPARPSAAINQFANVATMRCPGGAHVRCIGMPGEQLREDDVRAAAVRSNRTLGLGRLRHQHHEQECRRSLHCASPYLLRIHFFARLEYPAESISERFIDVRHRRIHA